MILLPLILAGLLFALPAHAQFEGLVESRNLTSDETGATQKFTMKLWVKKDMVKIEISAMGSTPGSTILYRRDVGKVVMLNDQEKTYFEIQQGAGGGNGQDRQGVERDAMPVVRRTGKSKKILGYSCDQVFMRTGEAETEYWGTKSLGALASAISQTFDVEGNEAGTGWNDDLMKLGYFPLLAQTRMGGKVLESSEVIKIEPRELSPEVFAIPPEYTKQGIRDLIKEEPGQKKR